MKHYALLFALMLLAACIPVDEWGTYWTKGVIDTRLEGKWEPVREPGKSSPETGVQISIEGENYRIDSMSEMERSRTDYVPFRARTLNAGDYTYLMAGEKASEGGLIRYEVKDDTLTEYDLKPTALRAFLDKHYPNAKNLYTNKCRPECKALYVRIGTFDDEVFEILSKVPDEKTYWAVAGRYKKVP